MLRLGVLGSGKSAALIPLIEAINQKRLSAQIVAILSDNQKAALLEKAADYKLPHFFIEREKLTPEEHEQEVLNHLTDSKVDLLLLIDYTPKLTALFINQWPQKMLSIHSPLLANFAKKTKEERYLDILRNQLKETGCAIRYVLPEGAEGGTLVQNNCIVLQNDDVNRLTARVEELEGVSLVEAIRLHQKKLGSSLPR